METILAIALPLASPALLALPPVVLSLPPVVFDDAETATNAPFVAWREDIRAGIALIIAALCARGTTEILNAESIDRGYERVEERLAALGADIKRVD